MPLQLFYSNNIADNYITLENDEHRHVIVLRKNIGDVLDVTDGKGSHFKVVITEIKKQFSVCRIESKVIIPKPSEPYIHLLISPTKQIDRIEWMFEKLVEMASISEISFLKTKYTERSNLNLIRFQKIAISAIKQSIQYHLPKINPLTDFKQAIDNLNPKSLNLIGHCYSEFHKINLNTFKSQKHQNINIFIGPEGDFSQEEIKKATDAQLVGIDLGEERLRTETAGLKSVILIKSFVL